MLAGLRHYRENLLRYSLQGKVNVFGKGGSRAIDFGGYFPVLKDYVHFLHPPDDELQAIVEQWSKDFDARPDKAPHSDFVRLKSCTASKTGMAIGNWWPRSTRNGRIPSRSSGRLAACTRCKIPGSISSPGRSTSSCDGLVRQVPPADLPDPGPRPRPRCPAIETDQRTNDKEDRIHIRDE